MAQAYCTECGNQIGTGDQVCRGCGAAQTPPSLRHGSMIVVDRGTNMKRWLLIAGGIVAGLVVLLVIAGVLFVLVVSALGGLTQGKSSAEEGITEFHDNYNGSNFESIYNNAHSDFKENASFEEFNEFMIDVHRKLGLVTSTTNQGWEVNSNPNTTSATMQQETKFEHGTGMETFTFVIEDEKALLLAYNPPIW